MLTEVLPELVAQLLLGTVWIATHGEERVGPPDQQSGARGAGQGSVGLIAELETVPRGLYTGAIGWFGFNGESQFSIAIRTVVIEGEEAHFHVGAGIVTASIPEAEWQETWDKAAGIMLAAERSAHRPR